MNRTNGLFLSVDKQEWLNGEQSKKFNINKAKHLLFCRSKNPSINLQLQPRNSIKFANYRQFGDTGCTASVPLSLRFSEHAKCTSRQII
jgi:hypothetical protein